MFIQRTQLKKELFSETASIMNISTSIVERDFWIVWILNKIFSDNRLNKILILNGGISLSKAFALTIIPPINKANFVS